MFQKSNKEEKPVLIFEIKRAVHSTLRLVKRNGLTQALLECLYGAQQYGMTRVVGCLTDVSTWHFLNCKFIHSPVGISVEGSRTVHVDGDDYSELAHCIIEMLMKIIEEEFVTELNK